MGSMENEGRPEAAGEIPATEGSETASLARDIEHIVNVICDEEALDRRQ